MASSCARPLRSVVAFALRGVCAADITSLIALGQGVLIPTPAVLLQPAGPAAASAAASSPHPSSSLLANGISRLPSSASIPGAIYLLCAGDAARRFDPKDMQTLGTQVSLAAS